MANRRKATSEAQNQVAAQRPDPVGSVSPPSPIETPSPPVAPVTQDQFAALVQQVQALTHLVQGRLEAPRPAVPAPRPPEEAADPVPPAISSSGPHGVADPHLHPKGTRPAPPEVGAKDLPRSRRARSLSPVHSRHDSTPSPHSPRPVPLTTPGDEIRQQIREMRQELDAAKQAYPPQRKVEQGIPFSKEIMKEVIPPHVKLPTIESYCGSTDPDDHLDQFLSRAIVSGLLRSSHFYIWNSLLHSLALSPCPGLSISLFDLIRKEGIAPDNYTFTSALKAIASLSVLRRGEAIHSLSLKLGLESDTFVQISLIHKYSACGSIGTARKVFNSAPDSVLDVVSWNSMISGYL